MSARLVIGSRGSQLAMWQAERAQATLERASVLDKTPRSKRNLVRLYFRTGQEEKGHQLLMELLGGKLSDPKTAESVADTLMMKYANSIITLGYWALKWLHVSRRLLI